MRTIARVKACVPTMGGSLTWARVAAGWQVYLDCRRECTYRYGHSVAHGVQVSHVCDAPDESLPPGMPAGILASYEGDEVFETIVNDVERAG